MNDGWDDAAGEDRDAEFEWHFPFYEEVLKCLEVLSPAEIAQLLDSERRRARDRVDVYLNDEGAWHAGYFLAHRFLRHKSREEFERVRALICRVISSVEKMYNGGVFASQNWPGIGKLLRCALDISFDPASPHFGERVQVTQYVHYEDLIVEIRVSAVRFSNDADRHVFTLDANERLMEIKALASLHQLHNPQAMQALKERGKVYRLVSD